MHGILLFYAIVIAKEEYIWSKQCVHIYACASYYKYDKLFQQ